MHASLRKNWQEVTNSMSKTDYRIIVGSFLFTEFVWVVTVTTIVRTIIEN